MMIGLQALAVTLIFVLSAAAVPVFAQLPALIPREVLIGSAQEFNPRISPNGKMLAYIGPDKGVFNVWVRTVGQNDDRVVTSDRKRGIDNFIWQEDGEHVLYIQDRDGDENSHIYQTDLQTKNTRNLTPFQGVRAYIIATSTRFPDQMLVALNLRDRKIFDIYRINLKNGAVELESESARDETAWIADSNLHVRAVRAYLPDGSVEIRVRDDVRSPWRSLRRWSGDETGDIFGFAPGDNAVWITSTEGTEAKRLLEVDISTGKTTVLAEDRQFDVASTLRNPRTRALEAVRFDRARSEWTVIDESLKADFDTLRKVREGDLYVVNRDREDKTWTVYYVTDDGPAYYYMFDRGARLTTFLFSSRPGLEKYKLAKMQPISFLARDGMTIYGYLTLPVGIDSKRLPLVIYVHGGPWTRDTWGYVSFSQMLANRGYAVLQVNFRGSTGYGKSYLNAGNREWGGKMHTDLLDGKNWTVKQGYADPKKVCIAGPSYGGYAVLAGLAFAPDEFVCGIDFYGPSNLVTFLRTMAPVLSLSKGNFYRRIGNLETEEEFLKSRSPFFHASAIRAPLLIFQGANDPRVPQAESDQIVGAIRKNGGHVDYIVFPDEGHGFARPENNLKAWAAIEQFLAKHLGGRAEPPSEKEKVDELRR